MDKLENKQYIFASVFLLANKLQKEGDALVSEPSLKQWFLLVILYRMKNTEPSINNIADKMGVTRQSVKKLVSSLKEKEYVTVTTSKVDSRALSVYPTKKAHQLFKTNIDKSEVLLDKVFDGIEDDELAIVSSVFKKLFSNLQREG